MCQHCGRELPGIVAFCPYCGTRQTLKATAIIMFPTEARATKWARSFDYARSCNALPALEVHPVGSEWGVFNPAPDQAAQPYRAPAGAEPPPQLPLL
jgi:zinc-ribbon domain